MPVSGKIAEFMERSSWIRKMFEQGTLLKGQHGPDNVFDFSLGNPNLEPSASVKKAILNAASDKSPSLHAYMPNAGLPATRAAVARKIIKEEGFQIDEKTIVMTVGAGGAMNVASEDHPQSRRRSHHPKTFFCRICLLC